MKALLTGATGFIGSHVAELLHSKGYEIRALIRPTSNKRFLADLPVEYVGGSLGDIDSLAEAVSGVDSVYHVAGVVAARDRKGFFEGNQLATANLLDACLRHNPGLRRFIHVSSQTAVGPSPAADQPVDERAPLAPITTYGQSKAAAEREVLARMEQLPATIVRPPAVYGPRDVGVLSFFQVAARGFAPLIGFDRKLVSLVHVEDLARGIVLAGESMVAQGETYFISSEEFYSWERVGEITARIFGRSRARYLRIPHAVVFAAAGASGLFGRFAAKPPILNFEKGRDLTRRYWTCSVAKAKRELGYRQQVDIESGVARTIAWYRDHGWL